jgi:hypothetical protein
MTLKYHSGEEAMKGDHVLLGGEPGRIEFVADPHIRTPDTLWYIEKFGGGIMISQLKLLGSVFIDNPESDKDLEFVGRASG